MGLQPILRLVDADPQDFALVSKRALSQYQSCVCSPGGGGEDNPIWDNALLHQFFHGKGITESASCARPTVRDEIRFSTICHSIIKCILQGLVTQITVCNCNNLSAEQLVK